MRGRRPTPTHLKLIKGDVRKEGRAKLERQAAREARRAPPALPSPPPELQGDGLREWQRLVTHLYSAGLLSEVDAGALGAVCSAYGVWMSAERMLSKIREKDAVFEGLLIKSAKNNLMANPILGIANKARNDYVRLAAEFGMTPAARARISAIEQPSEDATDEYFDWQP